MRRNSRQQWRWCWRGRAERGGLKTYCAGHTKSKVRARGEHLFLVIKRVVGFAKVRYRGLLKNAQRLFVAAALANLYMVRRQLLRLRMA